MPAAAGRAALVFGGAPVARAARLDARLQTLHEPLVIAADSGARTALSLGWVPHVVVGDMDSLDPSTLEDLAQRGVTIESFPRDKNATDGQLALEYALRAHPQRLVLVGYLGGPRLDQALANVFLLATTDVPALLLDAQNECLLLRDGDTHAWHAEPGEIVSLLPLGQDAHGVSTHGLRWPLTRDTLRSGHTRGISNEPVSPEVAVSVERGRLLVTRHFTL